MYNFDVKKIKKNIDNTIYWIRVDKKKSSVLVKGSSNSETKNELNNIVKKENLKDAIIYKIKIKFYSKNKIDTNGPISFDIDNYTIKNKKLKKIKLDGKYGIIWFEDEWLKDNNWNKKYITTVVNNLKKNKANIIIPGINFYHLMGKK